MFIMFLMPLRGSESIKTWNLKLDVEAKNLFCKSFTKQSFYNKINQPSGWIHGFRSCLSRDERDNCGLQYKTSAIAWWWRSAFLSLECKTRQPLTEETPSVVLFQSFPENDMYIFLFYYYLAFKVKILFVVLLISLKLQKSSYRQSYFHIFFLQY